MNKEIKEINIIQPGIKAREWVQNELINRQLKLYNKDSSAMSSTFQLIWFGVDNSISNSSVQYLKQQNLLFISGALTYLKLQNYGWFGELSEFLWDKLKKDLETKFEQEDTQIKSIFLMETKPYFYMTKVYDELIKLKDEKVEGEETKS